VVEKHRNNGAGLMIGRSLLCRLLSPIANFANRKLLPEFIVDAITPQNS